MVTITQHAGICLDLEEEVVGEVYICLQKLLMLVRCHGSHNFFLTPNYLDVYTKNRETDTNIQATSFNTKKQHSATIY